MKQIIVTLLFIGSSVIAAQDLIPTTEDGSAVGRGEMAEGSEQLVELTLSLESCLEDVLSHAPRVKDKALLVEQGTITEAQLRSNWYPQLSLNATVSYQSDVLALDLGPSAPFSIPSMSHDQYNLSMDLRQSIYDGGYTKQRKNYASKLTAGSVQEIEMDMQVLKEQTVQLYFSLLLLQEQRKTYELVLKNLKLREENIQAAIKNGVGLEGDMKQIQVEILKVLQQTAEVDAGKRGVLDALSVFSGKEYGEDVVLSMPYLEVLDETEVQRPEIEQLSLQSDLLEASKDLSQVTRKPNVYAFGQTGLGKPGLNMLGDAWDTYYIVGAGLKWTIWDWNSSKQDKQKLDIQQQVLSHRKETLEMKFLSAAKKELQRMEHLRKSVDMDRKMLEMRKDITEQSASQLDNGTITTSEYLLLLNEEQALRLRSSLHQLQLIQAMANYQLILGTL